MAGFRLTTKVQVSGWRFLLRRVEHAIVRRDTRMFDDPLQFYSRAVSLGIVIAVLVCLGAALLAYFKPLGKRGGDNLLVDRTTNQLYVVMAGTNLLHPVYNLTSARLVLGNPGTPNAVKSDELNRMAKGQPIGIPGAPYATPVSTVAESMWTLCDTVTKPESVAPTVDSSVIVLPLVTDDRPGPCAPTRACWCPTRTRTGWSPIPAGTRSSCPTVR
jgi:type VII secretion protein EccB